MQLQQRLLELQRVLQQKEEEHALYKSQHGDQLVDLRKQMELAQTHTNDLQVCQPSQLQQFQSFMCSFHCMLFVKHPDTCTNPKPTRTNVYMQHDKAKH